MRSLCMSVAVAFAFVSIANAQNEDPFGGGGGGGAAAEDPFGGAGGDPFGGGAAGDPFANPQRQARPARAVRQPAAKKNPVVGAPSNATARIRASLGEETTQAYIDTPLVEAVQQLARDHDVPIIINVRALEEIGLSPDVPVNLELKDVSLRSFLRLMLRDLDLTYMVSDEVLQITTLEAAEQNLTTEAYAFPKILTDKSDQVVGALTSTVSPNSWEQLGGPCRVKSVGHVLVISGTEIVHEGVREFFEKLQVAYEKHQAKQ